MDISVIIVSFNTKALLKNCLISLVKETKGIKFEIIVVDNNSTDETLEMLEKEFKDIKLIKNKENSGFAKANNQGIKISSGKYLLLLNSDTVILDNALSKSVRWMDKNKKAGIAGCQLLNEDGSVQQSSGYFPRLSRIFLWATFLDDLPFVSYLIKPYQVRNKNFYQKDHEFDWVTGAAFLIRREVVKKAGLLDEHIFMYGEELEYCYRVKKNGWKVFFTSVAKIIHLGGDNLFFRKEKAVLGEYEGLKYFFKKYKPKWEYPFLVLFLKTGALLRFVLFGIILGRSNLRRIYAKAYQAA